MKKYLKHPISFFILVLSLCILPQLIASGTPTDPNCDPDAYCPIDGGLSILIVAGVAIGIKKIKDERKKKNNLPNA